MGRLGSDHRQMQQIAAHALRTSFQLKIRQRVVGCMRDSAGRETLQADTSALSASPETCSRWLAFSLRQTRALRSNSARWKFCFQIAQKMSNAAGVRACRRRSEPPEQTKQPASAAEAGKGIASSAANRRRSAPAKDSAVTASSVLLAGARDRKPTVQFKFECPSAALALP